LTVQLTDEFGEAVPAALIARTVEAASATPRRTDPEGTADAVAGTARADVAALADAIRRSTAR